MVKALFKLKTLASATRRLAGLGVALPVGVGVCSLAQAQSYEEGYIGIEEIVVTAQKRTETLQDVPVAVGVMNAERLADPGIDSFLDAAIQMPGVSFLGTGEQRATVVLVRGIGTSSNNIGVEPSTTLMLDGEVMVRSGAINADLTDLERLEVLRGPQSTLFGKNASAGVIHYISKRPLLDETEGKVAVKIAEDNEFKVTSAVSVPLSEKMAFRSAAYYGKSDGYQKNNYPGNDNGGKLSSWGIRNQFLIQVNDELEVLLRGELSKKETNCCGSSIISSDKPDLMVRTSATDPSQQANLFKLTRTRIGFDHGTTTMNGFQQHTMENRAASIEVNQYIGDNVLSYQGYYRNWENEGNADPWSLAIRVYPHYFAGTNVAKSTQHEFRWTSPGDQAFDYVLGAVYFKATTSRDARELRCSRVDQGTVFDPQTLDVLSCRSDHYANSVGGKGEKKAPAGAVFGANGDVIYDFSHKYNTSLDAENMAVFGQLDVNITPGLKWSIGARYLHEETQLKYEGGRKNINNWPNEPGDGDNTTSENAFIGKTALQYNWTDNLMTYVSYARGYKGVGWFNTISVSRERLNHNQQDPHRKNGSLAAERPEQIELGLRSSWLDNRLTANLTAFHIDNKDFQERVRVLDDDPNSSTYQQDIGDFRNIHVRSQGVEFEFIAKPINRLTLKASGAYTDAKYQEGYQRCPPDRQGEGYTVVDFEARARSGQCFKWGKHAMLALDGLQIANSLKKQYRLSADYNMPVTDAGDTLGFNLQYHWKDRQQSRADQRLGSITDSFGILDLAVRFKDAGQAWNAEIFVKNALDKAYYTRVVPLPDWLGGGYRGVAARNFSRYVGAQVTYNF